MTSTDGDAQIGAQGTNRRQFLRAAAATTTFVWAAPVISGLGSAAVFAQVSPAPDAPPGSETRPDSPPRADSPPEVLEETLSKPRPDAPLGTETPPDVADVAGSKRRLDAGARPSEQPEVLGVRLEKDGALPQTGADSTRLLGLGTAALAAGAVTLRGSRHGATSSSHAQADSDAQSETTTVGTTRT